MEPTLIQDEMEIELGKRYIFSYPITPDQISEQYIFIISKDRNNKTPLEYITVTGYYEDGYAKADVLVLNEALCAELDNDRRGTFLCIIGGTTVDNGVVFSYECLIRILNNQIAQAEINGIPVPELPDFYNKEEIDDMIAEMEQNPYDDTAVKADIADLQEDKADLVDGIVPTTQLPSTIIEVATLTALPSEGESGKIYIAVDTNLTYRWSGTQYVEISSSLDIGETADSAFAGNRGKAVEEDVHSLKADVEQDLAKKQNNIQTINITDTTTLDLEQNTLYSFTNPITSLTINACEKSLNDIILSFTTGATFQLIIVESINFNYLNEIEFEANKSYRIAINNLDIVFVEVIE